MEMGAVKTLIVWDELTLYRHERFDDENKIVLTTYSESAVEQGGNVVSLELVEWFIANHKAHGCELQFVSNKTAKGNQFCKGFGGVGAILQYSVNPELLGEQQDEVLSDYDEF